MITSIKKILMPGLLYAVAAGASVRGAETQTASVPNEDNPNGSTAKIIEVDTTKRTLTLQAKGANHAFFLNPNVINTRTHQQIALNQLASGEFISFVTRPRTDGRLEIVSLMVLHHESGRPSGGGIHGGPVDVSPFN
jgi:hypothetical protein